MKPTTIEFEFDDSKLEAINIFLKEKDSTLTDELAHFMDSLYKKYVPQSVREFIEKKESMTVNTQSASRSTRKKPSTDKIAIVGNEDESKGNTRTKE